MSISNLDVPKTSRFGSATIAIFCAAIFTSASLLFFVQPLFAKLVLPKIGGAPAVWTTAMLFFQVVLILGYVYAHLLTKFLPLRWQIITHFAFWVAALTFLPLSTSESWSYDASTSTALQTLGLFAVGVGVPFAVLSANAPLLQAWYARSGGPSADDPYFLYSASNVGSLLALLAFPLVADPFFGAAEISRAWLVGFVLFGALLLGSGMIALRGSRHTKPSAQTALKASFPTLRQIAVWVFVAFIPSSLMLSFTTRVSTDLGALPLIWVVPLAVYILSFIIAFAKWKRLTLDALNLPMLAALAAGVVLVSKVVSEHDAPAVILLYVPVLFVIALFAHRLLYDMRPSAEQLTVFYIALSVGGAIGGLFNSILAPIAFTRELEAPITMILAGGLFLVRAPGFALRHVIMGIAASVFILVIAGATRGVAALSADIPRAGALFALIFAVLYLFRAQAMRIPVVLTVVLLPAFAIKNNPVFEDRSFFGVHSVYSSEGYRVYKNGTTVHGWQRESEYGTRPTPLSYYHPDGPMAQVITSDFGKQSDSIGIVGLGTGALACYRQPAQNWDFFEIDATVDQIARDPSLFTYLSECTPDSQTHLGDARIVLKQKPFAFDILVLDAYSSDAIPLHLITREAVEMYTSRLADDGVLVFHITNRFYDLVQPLARIADSLNLTAAHQRLAVGEEQIETGAATSSVVILSPDKSRIESFAQDGNWQIVETDGALPWTDDKANLLSALKLLKNRDH
ncbi:fused MFS/spermidine synthase [Ruegeria marisrubri]|uniref:fused MFS/spermidine synthase n=1 Tax=Ruegeria marisrubri TaxID=1685379 RepID=UPI001CD5FC87|nr:fused MFS/spermidine synthase [Ruegeria marisrubri]MCA0905305.1 fused MFS/spermidine synthase [Ruegeria marisrubri]